MDSQHKDTTQNRIDADIHILTFLIEGEGLSRTVRFMQYALEKLSVDMLLPMNGEKTDEAAKYSKAAEDLEAIYEKFKNEYKL